MTLETFVWESCVRLNLLSPLRAPLPSVARCATVPFTINLLHPTVFPRSMTTGIATLLSVILAATSLDGYPVRIGMTAQTLHDLASTRLTPGNHLHVACANLYDNTTDPLEAGAKRFTDDDAKVLGFFMGGRTTQTSIS